MANPWLGLDKKIMAVWTRKSFIIIEELCKKILRTSYLVSLGISQKRKHWRKVILRNLFFTGCSKFKFSHRIGLLFLPLFQWLWETVRDLEMGPPTLLPSI